jgi:hypothetical protein
MACYDNLYPTERGLGNYIGEDVSWICEDHIIYNI